jgi:hypothetical protein
MSGFVGPVALAPAGTTGNNTHASVGLHPGSTKIGVQYVAEVAGTTATWKVQVSIDRLDVTDANSNWIDMPYVLSSGTASDTLSQAAIVRTALGADIIHLANPAARHFKKIRLVVSANTGQTYRGELHQLFTH